MNRNQRRAVQLAGAILAHQLDPADLPDGDWALLLLAADLHNPLSLPPFVARRVLEQSEHGRGYFADWARGGDRFRAAEADAERMLVPEPGATPSTATAASALTPARPAPLRVLVADGHADTARLLARVFRDAGLKVRTALSFPAAVRLAHAERFDLLVSATGLPGGDGCDLLVEVSRLYPVRAVALSGYGLARDRARCAAAGFDRLLLKPVAIEELRAVIDAAADLARFEHN